MDDPLEVGVLHRVAQRHEQLQPLLRAKALLVAVVGDRHPAAKLHHEVGLAAGGGAGVEHAGNVGVVHQRQRLAFRFETRDDVPRVHARLDDLERDPSLDRLVLLGEEDDAHAALADRLQQPVRADRRARPFSDRPIDGGDRGWPRRFGLVRSTFNVVSLAGAAALFPKAADLAGTYKANVTRTRQSTVVVGIEPPDASVT